MRGTQITCSCLCQAVVFLSISGFDTLVVFQDDTEVCSCYCCFSDLKQVLDLFSKLCFVLL